MNKFSFSFALVSLVFFIACSDDKKETRADICEKGPSMKCLAGTWQLNKIGGESASGTLTLMKDGNFEFDETQDAGKNQLGFSSGAWSVEGQTITFNCGDCQPPVLSGTMSSSDKYSSMTITSVGRAAASRYSNVMVPNPVEEFTYIGE